MLVSVQIQPARERVLFQTHTGFGGQPSLDGYRARRRYKGQAYESNRVGVLCYGVRQLMAIFQYLRPDDRQIVLALIANVDEGFSGTGVLITHVPLDKSRMRRVDLRPVGDLSGKDVANLLLA